MLQRGNFNRGEPQAGGAQRTGRRLARAAVRLTGIAALALAAAPTALASTGGASHHNSRRYHKPAIELVAITPGPGDTAGAGGVFNVDLALLARNAKGNHELSAANGYQPGINSPAAATFGIGKPDPFAPGLVVTLSTTPQAAGGPKANLAGVFQLTDVARSNGLAQVFNDWEVGKAGAFGENTPTTLTAYLVQGTAPGIVTGSEKPISNVVRETFTIGG
ncbi:MAG: hypothetical protein JO039_21255 [Solirubrobacterales bacterium]|nr:hypothetical protein [Solirubrobacterales bacterium]